MKFYSDVTKNLYDTIEACEAAEAAFLKAEEEKKNGHKLALAELDELYECFQEAQRVNKESYKAVVEASKVLHKKYLEYQRKYGQLPDKHYTNYILTRMI
jgi:hypothetical protein